MPVIHVYVQLKKYGSSCHYYRFIKPFPVFMLYNISLSSQYCKPIVLNFLSGVPEAPDDVQSTYQTCVSVTLQWLRGFNGGLEQTFTVTYTDLNTSQEYTVSDIEDTRDEEIIWKVTDGILPSHRYRFHVTAVNLLGTSATVTAEDIYTPGMLMVNILV